MYQKSVLHVQTCFLLIRPINFFGVLWLTSPFSITRLYFCVWGNYRYINESFASSPNKSIYYEDLNTPKVFPPLSELECENENVKKTKRQKKNSPSPRVYHYRPSSIKTEYVWSLICRNFNLEWLKLGVELRTYVMVLMLLYLFCSTVQQKGMFSESLTFFVIQQVP